MTLSSRKNPGLGFYVPYLPAVGNWEIFNKLMNFSGLGFVICEMEIRSFRNIF